MAAVLFWDVIFWDNRFPAGEGIGQRVGSEEVVAWGPAGYALREVREVPIATVATAMAPLVAGMQVSIDAAPWDVLATDATTATVRATVGRDDPTRLADPDQRKMPIVVAWLAIGMVYFTVRLGFPQVRAFGHALRVTRGDYDDHDDPGEISHFRALTSALSGTLGLGNIAGVAIAIAIGGPGAMFWMTVSGLFGMASKLAECTLGQLYRVEQADGTVSGGPMHYLTDGLGKRGWPRLGKALAVTFAVLCMGGSVGGGNMFQSNQSFAAVADVVPFFADKGWLFGLLMAFGTGLVIIGGIKRIGAATSFIVPFMVAIYMAAGAWILVVHAADIPHAALVIVREAFSPVAVAGGFVGSMAVGLQRAAFSNEAGIGSASIAHSAARTRYGVREGIVSLLEPFIDTVVVCNMTAIVVIVTGAYHDDTTNGVVMTSRAFASVLPWFPVVLTVAVVLFAYATMISWSYYGERCAVWLFGPRASLPFRLVFLFGTFGGAVFELGHVLDFSDLMILGMAFPNLIGVFLLSGEVRKAYDDYWARHLAGEFTPGAPSARPAA